MAHSVLARASICHHHGLTVIPQVDHIPLIRVTTLPAIFTGIVRVIAVAALLIITVSTVFGIVQVAVTTTNESCLDTSVSLHPAPSKMKWIVVCGLIICQSITNACVPVLLIHRCIHLVGHVGLGITNVAQAFV